MVYEKTKPFHYTRKVVFLWKVDEREEMNDKKLRINYQPKFLKYFVKYFSVLITSHHPQN